VLWIELRICIVLLKNLHLRIKVDGDSAKSQTISLR